MPQAIAAGAVKAFFVKLVVAIAVNVAANKIAKAFQKRPTRVLQKVDVEYSGGLEPRRRLYGYFRASGLNTIPAITNGGNGGRLHKLLTLSDGQIESIDAVFFNNDRLPVDASFVGGAPITTGKYDSKAYLSAQLGLPSQSVDNGALAVPRWTTEHRGNGIAYLYMFFLADNQVYSQGVPNVVVEGKGKIIYDPRLDTSPGANPTNSAYVAFSTNPALILTDFLLWDAGGNELAANVQWSDVVTAANICDEAVTVPDGVGGTTTQDRYTCSVEVYAPQTHTERSETIAMLARAMMGACWFSGGKWRMRAGAYSSPVGTITDDHFLGDDIDISTAQTRATDGVFNTVRGSYVDANEYAQPKAFPEVSSAAYVADDGEVIAGEVEFHTCRNVYEAERNAILLLRQARRRIHIAATLRFSARAFQLYDVVSVTLTKIGWVDQPARIVRIVQRQDFTIDVELQEISSADFADPSTSDYLTPNAVALPESEVFRPNPPEDFAATGAANAIIFTWSPPSNAPGLLLYRLYEHTASTPFSSATQVGPDTPQTSIVLPRTDTSTRYYWVVSVMPTTGQVSTQAPPSNGLPAAPASAGTGLAAVIVPGTAEASVYSSSATTNSVAVTPTGGTAPYVYAWTFTAGGTGITITSSTSAATTFSATSLSEGETRSGTARCRVTDNVGATYDVFAAVTIVRGYSVSLTNRSLSATGALGGPGSSGSPAICQYVVLPTGEVHSSPTGTGGGGTDQWLSPAGNPSDYDVRFTLNSGAIASGTLGTWQQITSGRQIMGVRDPGAGSGTTTANITVEIRLHASPFTVVATATLMMAMTIP